MSSERRLFKDFGGVRNSAVASQPRPSGHITADKREIKDFPKLPSATSSIRVPLYVSRQKMEEKLANVSQL